MKLLHIISGLGTGGAERALYNLLAGGLAAQFDCTVLSLRDKGTMGPLIEDLGVPVETLGLRGNLAVPGALLRLRRLVVRLQPDVIQGWMYHGNLAANLAGWLAPGRPTVAWNVRHSLYDLGNERWMTAQIIRLGRVTSSRPKAIIYNSELARAQHQAFGFAAGRGHVIPNGFDLEKLQPDPTMREEVLPALGIAQDATVVGHVARYHRIKDHAGYLRAAVDVARDHPQVRFLLVGHDITSDNTALIRIIPSDLAHQFIFAGERKDVPRLMQAMDLLCLSSISEGFPNVLGEAMTCGVPCVTTDVGDSAAVVGETGIVVPASDTGALGQGLRKLVTMPVAERRALGQRARKRIIDHYGLNAIVARYAQLYEEGLR